MKYDKLIEQRYDQQEYMINMTQIIGIQKRTDIIGETKVYLLPMYRKEFLVYSNPIWNTQETYERLRDAFCSLRPNAVCLNFAEGSLSDTNDKLFLDPEYVSNVSMRPVPEDAYEGLYTLSIHLANHRILRDLPESHVKSLYNSLRATMIKGAAT